MILFRDRETTHYWIYKSDNHILYIHKQDPELKRLGTPKTLSFDLRATLKRGE